MPGKHVWQWGSGAAWKASSSGDRSQGYKNRRRHGRPVSGLATRAVHAGERMDPSGAVNTPIVASTTYRYPEMPDGSAATHIYSRYDNPTVQALEAKVAALEGGQTTFAFASGMGAIAAVCQAWLRPGDTIAIMAGVYGGTLSYLQRELAPMGIGVHIIDAFADEPLPAETRMVWLESITNPLLRVPDIKAWAAKAHAAGARLVVDATFATPVLQRPLELGADVVVHSATKFLGGHADVTAGVATVNEGAQRLWETRRNLGSVLDPYAATLVSRGIKTLALRVRAQAATAAALAAALVDEVTVHHPSRPDHPDAANIHALDGPGAVLTLDVGSLERAIAFRRKVRVLQPAASLGGVESLVSLPLETSHSYMTAEERAAIGVTDGLLRISVGIEDFDDLLEDIRGALHD